MVHGKSMVDAASGFGVKDSKQANQSQRLFFSNSAHDILDFLSQSNANDDKKVYLQRREFQNCTIMRLKLPKLKKAGRCIV